MTSGSATATVSVFLGNGNGSFGVRTDFGTGPYPHGLAIDDVNGDGRLDLVTANNPRTVSVLLGNGDGSFGAKHDFSTVDYAEGVVIGDLNGDGIPDLATQNYRGSGLPGTISVLIGNGDGSFGAANTSIGSWSDASNPASLAIGDLNGDGKRDLVATNYEGYGLVSVLLGSGNGTFVRTEFVAAVTPFAVAIADINLHGKPDLVTTNGTNVAVLLGNGDGTFAPPTSFPANGDPTGLAIGDVNNDGRLDVVTSHTSDYSLPYPYYGNKVGVLLGNGDGSLQTQTIAVTPAAPLGVAAADLNGDGNLDMVAACSGVTVVSVLLGDGLGGFGAKADFS